jgi:hypothetical protein
LLKVASFDDLLIACAQTLFGAHGVGSHIKAMATVVPRRARKRIKRADK